MNPPPYGCDPLDDEAFSSLFEIKATLLRFCFENMPGKEEEIGLKNIFTLLARWAYKYYGMKPDAIKTCSGPLAFRHEYLQASAIDGKISYVRNRRPLTFVRAHSNFVKPTYLAIRYILTLAKIPWNPTTGFRFSPSGCLLRFIESNIEALPASMTEEFKGTTHSSNLWWPIGREPLDAINVIPKSTNLRQFRGSKDKRVSGASTDDHSLLLKDYTETMNHLVATVQKIKNWMRWLGINIDAEVSYFYIFSIYVSHKETLLVGK